MKPHISVVSPVYGGERTTDELVRRVSEACQQITPDYEIILVEDHSPDKSWEAIAHCCAANPRVRGIKLSKNHGQHFAITAGLDHAQGEWVVVMDCDLQDVPEEIPRLYQHAVANKLDYVQAVRAARKDRFFKRLGSFFFYKILSLLVGSAYDHRKANFGIYHHKVVGAINGYRESSRFFPSLVHIVGFKGGELDVQHDAGGRGGSTYNLRKLLRLAEDIILAHSDKPLRYISRMGFLLAFVALVFGVITLFRWYMGHIVQMGYASLILSILFSTGILLFTLGILGLYIGKIFDGVKNRPLYLVEETQNLGDETGC